MFHKDYLIRQIEYMTEAIACTVFNKEATAKYESQSIVSQSEIDLLSTMLRNLLDKKNINEAENLLYTMLDPNNHAHHAIAIDFYSRLNSLSDQELEAVDFSREEIANGLNEIKAIFSLSF